MRYRDTTPTQMDQAMEIARWLMIFAFIFCPILVLFVGA